MSAIAFSFPSQSLKQFNSSIEKHVTENFNSTFTEIKNKFNINISPKYSLSSVNKIHSIRLISGLTTVGIVTCCIIVAIISASLNPTTANIKAITIAYSTISCLAVATGITITGFSQYQLSKKRSPEELKQIVRDEIAFLNKSTSLKKSESTYPVDDLINDDIKEISRTYIKVVDSKVIKILENILRS